MSDALVRLRIENSEYDAKLKRATEGLQRYVEGCRKAGGTLEVVEKDTLDFVKALGTMETTSKSATGKLNEMKKAFVEWSVIYKEMNAEEKKGDFGKALSASLDQLKTRINDSKKNLSEINQELGETTATSQGTGNAIEMLAGKFGVNTKMIGEFGLAIGATTAALKFAKDVFTSSEANMDEWGRVVEASQTIYESFLTSINNGDVGGFLTKIGQIEQAARAAYDALDNLNTQKAIQSPQVSAKNTEIQRMETMLRTGRYIAPVDGRKAAQGLKDGEVLTKAQKDAIAKNLQEAMAEVADITKSQVSSATKAIDALYNEQAAVLGVSKKEFLDATSSWSKFTDALDKSEKYWKWRNENTTYETRGMGMNVHTVARYDDSQNPYKGWGWVKTFKDGGEKFNRLLEEIQKRDASMQQLYGQQARTYRSVNRVEGVTPYGGGGGGAKTTVVDIAPEGSVTAQIKLVQDLQKAWRDAADDDSRKRIKAEIEQAQTVLDVMNGKTTLNDITITVNDAEALEQIKNIEGISLDPKTLTVDAETGEAVKALNAVEGITLDPKNVTVTADTSEALAKLQDIQGIKIEPIEVEGLKALAAAKKQYADAVKNTPTFEGFKGGVAESMRQTDLKVDTNTLTTMMQVAIQNGIDGLDVDFEHLWRKMGTSNIEDSTWQELQDQINEKLAELNIDPIQIDFKTGNLKTVANDAKKVDDGFQSAMQSVQSLGSALNNLEDPGAKVAGTVAQAIAQIALGFSQATTAAAGGGPFAWIAAIAGGLATMTSTIAAIHNATGYAEGGLVKGPGGVDNVPAWLSDGEIVLNAMQQKNVAQAIMSGNEGGGESGGGIPYVTGETIVLGMNNHLKRSGQGEIVTTGMLKRMKLI